ncbi:MAG: DUF523 domain-containing protein [Candidatus Asgardarchaeia archaeon]
MRILVSACLLGVNCKYNGGNNKNENVLNLIEKYVLIPVCPEQLGGLSTPREPAEIVGGNGSDVLSKEAKVVTNSGKDITQMFVKGAEETLKIAKLFKAKIAILKDGSPSCGVKHIYDGTFTHRIKSGSGVTASILKKSGMIVISEVEIDKIKAFTKMD